MRTEELNLKASNSSGARPDYLYGSMLDQMRYIYALQYVKDKNVLDIACGIGWGSYLMAMSGAQKVFAIDLSQEAIHTAKKYYINPNIVYICGSLEDSNIPDKSIDVVTSFETFEHLENPILILNEFHRILKPNGVLLLSTPNGYATKFKQKDLPHNPYHFQEYFKKEIVQMLGDKWEILEYKGQYPMRAESTEIFKYRRFIRDYFIITKLVHKIGILGRVVGFVFRRFGILTLAEPAFVGSCEPVDIQNSNEPAYHYFILRPKIV